MQRIVAATTKSGKSDRRWDAWDFFGGPLRRFVRVIKELRLDDAAGEPKNAV
jgi:hypothetical protein